MVTIQTEAMGPQVVRTNVVQKFSTEPERNNCEWVHGRRIHCAVVAVDKLKVRSLQGSFLVFNLRTMKLWRQRRTLAKTNILWRLKQMMDRLRHCNVLELIHAIIRR